MISPDLVGDIKTQLRRDEGVREKPYVDSVGKVTIGVGRNLTDNGLSPDEIDYLFENDVAGSYASLVRALPWVLNLDDSRQGALLNMTFNMGIETLLTFKTFLTLMQKGDFDGAAQDLKGTKWATEVKDRAARLEEQLVTGVWQ